MISKHLIVIMLILYCLQLTRMTGHGRKQEKQKEKEKDTDKKNEEKKPTQKDDKKEQTQKKESDTDSKQKRPTFLEVPKGSPSAIRDTDLPLKKRLSSREQSPASTPPASPSKHFTGYNSPISTPPRVASPQPLNIQVPTTSASFVPPIPAIALKRKSKKSQTSTASQDQWQIERKGDHHQSQYKEEMDKDNQQGHQKGQGQAGLRFLHRVKLSKIRSSKPGSKRFVLVMTDLASNDPITRRPHLGKRKHSRAKKVGRGKKRRLPDKGEDDTKSQQRMDDQPSTSAAQQQQKMKKQDKENNQKQDKDKGPLT